MEGRSQNGKTAALSAACVLLLSAISSLMIVLPTASAQTQYVVASPGYINLGMSTTITATAPAAGTYTVVVLKPGGSATQVTFTFGAAGATQSAVYGTSGSGFGVPVNQAGTYNVFLEQGSTIISTTSFYATNKMIVQRFDTVDGGTCIYVQDVTRGSKMFPRFFVAYASNNAWVTNSTLSVVTFTLPDGTLANATWHKPSAEGVGFFIGKVYPNWNSSWTGNYLPTAKATDIYGNTMSWNYTGRPFQILPSPLTASVQLIDSKSGQVVAGLYNGQNLDVTATVAYTAAGVTGTEVLPGYLGPLDISRGGAVTGVLGWGFYNASTNSFGSTKNPGGLITSLTLSYTGSKGVWSAPLAVSALPTIPTGTTYELILNAKDGVPTPNTASLMLALPPATVQTSTATSVSIATTTATSTSTSISTATSTATATTTAFSTVTASGTGTQATAQAAGPLSDTIYAAMAIIVLIGFAIGFIVRRPRTSA